MEPNKSGIQVAEARRAVPIFTVDGETLDITAELPLASILFCEEWLFECFEPHCIAENDAAPSDPFAVTASADLTNVWKAGCFRCRLRVPTAPQEIGRWVCDFFSATQWYSFVEDSLVSTPKSCFFHLEPGQSVQDQSVLDKIDQAVKSQFGGKCFARMSHASSKLNLSSPCFSANDVVSNLMSSERTAATLRVKGGETAEKDQDYSFVRESEQERVVMLREWVPNMGEQVEMRCFVHHGSVRGVVLDLPEAFTKHLDQASDSDACSNGMCHSTRQRLDLWGMKHAALKAALRLFLANLTCATEYADYVADVAIPSQLLFESSSSSSSEHSDCVIAAGGDLQTALWLVEINTPVYLLATSGHFCLDLSSHREILLSTKATSSSLTELGIVFPVLMVGVEGRADIAEIMD